MAPLYRTISLKTLQFNALLVLLPGLEASLIVKGETFERPAYNVHVILFIVLLDLEVALAAKGETVERPAHNVLVIISPSSESEADLAVKGETVERSAYYKTFDYTQTTSQKTLQFNALLALLSNRSPSSRQRRNRQAARIQRKAYPEHRWC